MIAFCFSGGGHNSNGSPMNPKGNESLFSLLSKGLAFRYDYEERYGRSDSRPSDTVVEAADKSNLYSNDLAMMDGEQEREAAALFSKSAREIRFAGDANIPFE